MSIKDTGRQVKPTNSIKNSRPKRSWANPKPLSNYSIR